MAGLLCVSMGSGLCDSGGGGLIFGREENF